MHQLRRTLLAAVLALPLAAAATAQMTAKVQFETGSDNAAVSGTITGQEYADYVLGARSGQTMSVSLIVEDSNGGGNAYFNILPPGSSGEAIFNGSVEGLDGSVTLPADGDYTIRVYQMGDDADSGKTTGFTLSVTIM